MKQNRSARASPWSLTILDSRKGHFSNRNGDRCNQGRIRDILTAVISKSLVKLSIVQVAVAVGLLSLPASAQTEVVLNGLPKLRVSENGVVRTVEDIALEDAEVEACLIQRIGNRYYWATHANVQVKRFEHGSFVTFVAMDGSGYVRLLDPDARSIFDGLNRTDGDYDYVEHFILGMTTVTYFGYRRDQR